MNKIIKKCICNLKLHFPLLIKIIKKIKHHRMVPITVYMEGGKRALLCYISNPFIIQDHKAHSNQKEVVVMASTLKQLGYSVDVVDFNSEANIDYSNYSLLLGFGNVFANSFSDVEFRGKRILHMTGANLNYSNQAEALRARQLKERKNVLLKPRREAYWPWMFSAVNSDAIFILGNSWTLSTYEGINKNLFLFPVPFVPPIVSNNKKDFESLRNRFCWFAGSGALHKGLDLILEAMDQLGGEYHLDVCGPIENEDDFIKLYNKELFENFKVTFHGFVDVESSKMKEIIDANCFVIFPSCSEGGGSSVITCMAAGLIPIVTKESSVEVKEFGISIKSGTISSIIDAMITASKISNQELSLRSHKAALYANTVHSYDNYRDKLKQAIIDLDSDK